MNIDLDYAKKLLGAFVDSSTAMVNSDELPGIELGSESYVFHMGIFSDLGLVVGRGGRSDLESLGVLGYLDGPVVYPVAMRLTARGHDFYKSLCNSEVLERLKSDFKDAPFEVMYKGGQVLLERFFKKKLDQLMDE